MNKTFRFIPVALAALMLGACSTNDDVVDGGANAEGTTSYVAVQIVNAGNASGTRAAYDPTGGSNNDYEDGTETEGKISSARFYFFDADGNPYIVEDNVNYLTKDISVSENSSEHNETVEGATTAVLVIENSKRVPPTSMVAIANCPTNNKDLGTGSKTLTELKAICNEGFATTGENTFVMSNSVYTGGCEVNVGSYVKQEMGDAEENPVVIYVERVVAKVNTALTNTEKDFSDGKKGYNVGKTAEGKEVYAKVMGWSVADENNKSYLLKNLADSYDDLGITNWSSNEYHRSFWATSSTDKGNNKYSWTAMSNNVIGTAQYTQESTPTSKPSDLMKNDLTKVVVAAQLVDEDGNAIELCNYRGSEYTGETAVKNAILSEIKNVYRIKTSDTEVRDLTADDLTFTNKTGVTGEDYEVYATVTEKDGNNQTISYLKSTDGGTTWMDCQYTEINTALSEDARAAQIRKDGKTYYYTTIKHFGDKDKLGEYGVVRNHSYVVTINSIKGFGTAVYFPENVIDPEPPTDSSTYLAAQIKVLSWRVVNSTVDLTTN